MYQALKQNYLRLVDIPYVWSCVAGNYSSDEAALNVFASSEGNGISSQADVCPQRSCCKKLHVWYSPYIILLQNYELLIVIGNSISA